MFYPFYHIAVNSREGKAGLLSEQHLKLIGWEERGKEGRGCPTSRRVEVCGRV
jgi:hypothetical protein